MSQIVSTRPKKTTSQPIVWIRSVVSHAPFVRCVAAMSAIMASIAVAGQQSQRPTQPEERAARSYPSIPGALQEPPEWMAKNAPFDVRAYFKPIPAEENAAPLYLDILYEFAPLRMHDCVSADEDAARGAALRERAARRQILLRRDQRAVSAAERGLCVVEYHDSFEKLVQAQTRPKCLFETPLDAGMLLDPFSSSSLQYADAARTVRLLADWSIELFIGKGELDLALDEIEMVLRLGRDLRPRGPWFSQWVSMIFDNRTASDMIPRILAAPDLRTSHCDRLLEIMERHDVAALDFSQGFRADYLVLRDLLHRLELREELGRRFLKRRLTNGQVLAKYVGDPPAPDPQIARELDELLEQATAADFTAEIETLNRYFRPLVGKALPPNADMERIVARHETAVEDLKLLRYQLDWVPGYFVGIRGRATRWGATKCLVALARWRLQQAERPPADLASVCNAAGMRSVPIDPFSKAGEPLRGIMLGDEFVVYSIAADGEDNEAQLVWDYGDSNGDWIFRLSRAAD